MGDIFPKRKSTRLQNFDYCCTGIFFITICTKDKICLLSDIVGTGVLDGPYVRLTKFGTIADKYINQLNDFYDNIFVEKYVIMPNHIHMVIGVLDNGPSRTPVPTNTVTEEFKDTCTVNKKQNSYLSKFISTFKRFCNKEYGENIWQSRSFDHIIRGKYDYEKIIKYIEENPARWYYDKFYPDNL